MALKYIINDGKLIMGNCEYHAELHGKNLDKKKTIGGGRYYFKEELYGKVVFFYGKSDEFGVVTKEQFEAALKNSYLGARMKNHEKIFTNGELGDAIKVWEEKKIKP